MVKCRFSAAKYNSIGGCQDYKASLWLWHSPQYNYVNAYNLAVMSALAYSRVDPNKQGKNINQKGDVAEFYDKCRNKQPFLKICKEDSDETIDVNPLFRYKETKDNKPLIERNPLWFVDTPDLLGSSSECFFFADDRNAVLAVRGTAQIIQDALVIDGDGIPTKALSLGLKGYLHKGFLKQATDIINDKQFKDFIEKIQGKKLFVTGHSLGGAVATIISAYLYEQKLNPLLYTFGSPRVGDIGFVQAYSNKFIHFRHVYHQDVVPTLPAKKSFLSTHDLVSGNLIIAITHILSRYFKEDLDEYMHHGTLCQICEINNDNMILPFETHGITGNNTFKKLTENAKNPPQDSAKLQNEFMNFSLADHAMPQYIAFLKSEIRQLWSLYKENGCNEQIWYNAKMYDKIIAEITTRKQILGQSHHNLFVASIKNRNDHRYYQYDKAVKKQLAELEHNKQKVLSYKNINIGTKGLFGLHAGDPNLTMQLEKF